MIDYTPKHLVMVSADANNNKYYDMLPDGETWTAKYGRVGTGAQTRVYSRRQFESKYNEKIRKGYVDQTQLVQELIAVDPSSKSQYAEITDTAIAAIVMRLQSMAHQAIEANYTISSSKVTQMMVDEAQSIIDGLLTIGDVEFFNRELLRLFATIPRKMGSVGSYIATKTQDFNKIISREQDLLDVMKGQVVSVAIASDDHDHHGTSDQTILEALGLKFETCANEDIATIRAALGSCSAQFYRAWRVTNLKTQERFDQFVADNRISDVRLLFHGSRNENWWSIIQSGLLLRPTNAVITGKMFGYGIYYAPKARKSLGYTSLNGSYWARGSSTFGFMALMDVAYGKPYDVYAFDHKYANFNYDELQAACPGANCLHAHAGSMLRNDEIIVYKEAQSTIKYLVELKG